MRVRAIVTDYNQDTGKQFCTTGNEYDADKYENGFEIIDDQELEHFFTWDKYQNWFEII